MKKFVCLFILICMLSLCLVSCNSIRYNEALDLIAEGNYEAAHKMFEKLDSYKDAKKQLKYFHYVPVKVEYNDDSFCDFFTMKIIYLNKLLTPILTVTNISTTIPMMLTAT